jgi:hypothetical protein
LHLDDEEQTAESSLGCKKELKLFERPGGCIRVNEWGVWEVITGWNELGEVGRSQTSVIFWAVVRCLGFILVDLTLFKQSL